MKESIDIVATTNPAYCSLVLLSFVEAFAETARIEPNFSLSFLAIPIAMSSDVNFRFKGTNRQTGLLEWIARNPELKIELPTLLRGTVPIVRATVIFGLRVGVFEITPSGGLRGHKERVRSQPTDPPGVDVTRRHYAAARSFGAWCGGVRSASTIFLSLGVAP